MGLRGFGRIGSMTVLVSLVSALALCGHARAMEGMDMSGTNNTCPLMAGMHEMHVSAYHAATGLFEELCMDIPATGKLSLTIDAVSAEIRDMTTEIKVVRGIGTEPEPVTLLHLPPARYPSGVATFTVDLDAPGKYALLVTLREGAMEMSATHVMTVAHPLQKWIFVPVGAAAILGAALFVYIRSERRKKLLPKSS